MLISINHATSDIKEEIKYADDYYVKLLNWDADFYIKRLKDVDFRIKRLEMSKNEFFGTK